MLAELPILVCLTKIDAYDPDVIGHDLAKTFHSSRLLQLVEVKDSNILAVTLPVTTMAFMHRPVCVCMGC